MNKKRIISICMAICIIAGMVHGTQAEVSAQNKKRVKVVFNGKSVTLDNNRGLDESFTGKEPKTINEVEKKLGKRTRKSKGNEEPGCYVWEKGKTKIMIQPALVGSGLGYACAEIKDKNGSLNGIKVGMTKAKALKKLRSIYGKKTVVVGKDTIGSGYGSCMEFSLKNGKISEIFWMRS